MNIICPTSVQCPGSDSPILNVSSEAPDHFYWWNYIYPRSTCVNRLNCNPDTYYAKDCFGVMYSATSQADADLQANSASVQCDTGGGVNTCVNEAQTATAYCADGTPVTYTTPAGMFSAPLVGNYQACLDSANAQALSYAQQQASALAQLDCPKGSCIIRTRSPLPAGIISTPYLKTISGAISGGAAAFIVVSGSLPPGLSMNAFGEIIGVPTTLGTYHFTVMLLNPSEGISCTKDFELQIVPAKTLLRYWTMEETAMNNRVDKVAGNSLTKSIAGFDFDSAPGLYGNAVHFDNLNGTSGPGTYRGCELNGSSTVDIYQDGFSFTAWVKLVSLEAWTSSFIKLLLTDSSAQTHWIEMGLGINGDGFAWGGFGSSYNHVPIVQSVGPWAFYHIFYDAVNKKVGYSINNGTENVFTTTSDPTTFVSYSLSVGNYGWFTLNEVLFDELTVYLGKRLNASQLAYLYNSGAGRTWPITLPP